MKWVNPSIVARLRAEFELARHVKANDNVLCFHGLPPVLKNKGNTFLFLQNRIHFDGFPLSDFSWKVRLRLMIERLILNIFKIRVDKFYVQTASMENCLRAWSKNDNIIVEKILFAPGFDCIGNKSVTYDFIYVANGGVHKNHINLIEAWTLLAAKNIKPSLCVTLGESDGELIEYIESKKIRYGLNVSNIGNVSHADMANFYKKSRALIYPSKTESLGLPLIEASAIGLHVLAGELDYVRDVCVPVQTFNPDSAVSIYRAVLRYLNLSEPVQTLESAESFLRGF